MNWTYLLAVVMELKEKITLNKIGGQRGWWHHSVVGDILEFLIPALFLSFLQVQP